MYIFNLRLSTLSVWVTVLTLRIDFCIDKVCIKGLFHFFSCKDLSGGRKKKICTVFGRVVPSSGSLLQPTQSSSTQFTTLFLSL